MPEAELTGGDTGPAPGSPVSKVFAVIGTVLSASILVAIVSSVLRFAALFNQIVVDGTGDPEMMAGGIAASLVPLVSGIITGSVGLLISLLTTLFSRYRSRWFYRCSFGFSIVYMLAFPVGTVIAICFLVVLIKRRAEFLPAQAGEPDT